jgi:hypothetical protein
MSILLLNKTCLYDKLKNETTIYGTCRPDFDSILIENVIFHLVFSDFRHYRPVDFYIKIKGKISNLKSIVFIKNKIEILRFTDVPLHFPFEDCGLQLNSTSAIISTMCKDYSHRLDEWIQYNLNLGFSGIVIFNNDSNKSNPLNESTENCIRSYSTEEICKKYKGKVCLVDFPYSPFSGEHWNSMQFMSFHIGINAFRTKCRNIALIDADEFIHIPNNKNKNINIDIEDFLQKYNTTITIQSNILTNMNDNDVLNNNILKLAKYIGEDKYTKTILHTDKISENIFIYSPHEHPPSEIILSKTEIIHYHCWMNKRYKYHENMPTIDLLEFSNNNFKNC